MQQIYRSTLMPEYDLLHIFRTPFPKTVLEGCFWTWRCSVLKFLKMASGRAAMVLIYLITDSYFFFVLFLFLVYWKFIWHFSAQLRPTLICIESVIYLHHRKFKYSLYRKSSQVVLFLSGEVCYQMEA